MINKRDVSVLIAARNEEFLSRTVNDVLKNKRANTEVIVVADGSWPNPPVKDHPDVTLIYHPESIGQRGAINEAAKISQAKYIMKLDAHCTLDEGFDVKLMADCEYDWTVIPRMYNLHVFDWRCKKCKHTWYQGPRPKECPKCKNKEGFTRMMVWKPRWNRKSDHMRFDDTLHFQYWGSLGKRPGYEGDITETMSFIGACFFMHRKRYWDIDGLDEKHGSWGQMGTEISCKTWLSGGRLVTNRKTWFSHMFRTQAGFGFPYPLRGSQVEVARQHSRNLWFKGEWPKAKHDLQWLIDKFAPIPDWPNKQKGIIFYTDNQLNMKIAHACQKNLKSIGLPIVSASLKPMTFGTNIHLKLTRSYLTMFKQILAALEASKSEFIFFCEHDVLYHPSHFDFTPPRKDTFYYNVNVWKLNLLTSDALHYECKQVSGICVDRKFAIEHYKKRVARVEKTGYSTRIGCEPGTHNRKERIDDSRSESWMSKFPNVDIRHGKNLTRSRWKVKDFRNQKHTKGWTEGNADTIPGWKKEQFSHFLK